MRLRMEDASPLTIPRLCVQVTCLNSLDGPPGVQSVGARLFHEAMRSYSGAMRSYSEPLALALAPALAPALPLPANSMLLSAVHPTTSECVRAFTADDGAWYLPVQHVALLRSAEHPLAMIVPGLRLQVHCANPPAENEPSPGYSHLLSFSVPLAACLKDLMHKSVFSVRRETAEDGMRYQLDVRLDTTGLSLAAVQQVALELQHSIDQLLHHQSLMTQKLGAPPKTVEQLVSAASALRQKRFEACQRVLEAVSPDTKCNFNLNLQYGRAFGMQVDQAQCRALREGSVLSHGFQQTLLHLTLAQASLIAKLAQEADIKLATELPAQHCPSSGMHARLRQHLDTQAPAALWHACLQQVQMAYCCRTKYHFDPSYGPTLKVAQAMKNADGSMTVRVVPTFGMISRPGEDQNLTPGTSYADCGLNLRDCEDGAMHINACSDVLRMHTLDVLRSQQASLLSLLPADIQAVGSSILKLTEVLHAHVNASAPPATPVGLERLNPKTFSEALDKAAAAPSHAQLYATSLLASAPQLAAAPLRGASADPSSKMDCSASEYNAWWTGALMQGDKQANLNGHAVAISVGLAPVLRTHVQDTPVDVHLIDPRMKIYESTAPAWQTEQADTAVVKLNLKKEPLTPMRLKLQQDLDTCTPLTMCMACNVRSALHTAETRQVIAHTLVDPRLQTGDSMLPPGTQGVAQQLPIMSPMQTFSLQAQADSEPELGRQLAFKFYKTLLAVGAGDVYSLDLHQSKVSVYAGMSMARQLSRTKSVVVGSPLDAAERQILHALGALQSSFLLDAPQTLASMPPLMPLALQQRMKYSADGQLVPLLASELRAAAHPCGFMTQTPLMPITHSSDTQSVVQNLTAMVSMAKQVVGQGLHVTGAPFADGLFLTFP